jgi:hypothetical protein
METPIIFAVEIEKSTSVTRDIAAMWIAYLGGVKPFHHLCHLHFDFGWYPLIGRKFLAGSALGSPFLHGSALWLMWTAYLNHRPSVKHNDVFIGGSITKTNLLPTAHPFRFSDGSLRKM